MLTLAHLDRDFDFKKILLDLEELVLGSSGVNVFNEIFKIIFAKIWDEKQALETRKDQSLEFKWFKDPELTYERINHLFQKAAEEWKGVFDENDKIKLQKEHLNVCIAPLERKRFLGSNLRIMDDAFEYLLPTEAKKKKGQFFTPRFVIDMCVRMLNPKRNEYILDPACGSAGFLVHAMDWAYPVENTTEMEIRRSRYASRYLWGIDFEEQAAKTSRALMLIAGDGHTNIFGPDVDTLNPKTWYRNPSGRSLMESLKKYGLTKETIPQNEIFTDEDNAWKYFEELKFDIILSNPPFAGEIKNREQLAHYQLAKNALKRAVNKQAKEERDVLFIERIIKMLKPGGRAAIVLPQGKFNNSSLAFIREWILRKARLLAVVGLHGNTFKPHTGAKTSVLFILKYSEKELADIEKIQNEVKASCPDYSKQIQQIIESHKEEADIPDENIPEYLRELLIEEFPQAENEANDEYDNNDINSPEENEPENQLTELMEKAEVKFDLLKTELLRTKQQLSELEDELESLQNKQNAEIKILLEKKIDKEPLRKIREEHKLNIKELKELHKTKSKTLKFNIKQLESSIPAAEYELNILTTKGRLKLIVEDEDLLQRLSDRYIDTEVARRLDYSIFMAVSEKGGKNNSGEYEFLTDEGNLVQDLNGNPVYKQDLVNYSITKASLLGGADEMAEFDAAADYKNYSIKPGIAEAFIEYAKDQEFKFWRD